MTSSQEKLSHAMEDYLRAIYKIEERGERVTTSALAAALEVTPASVTNMLKRLAGLDLVKHQRYRGVVLAPKGKRAALEIVRHHRLLELFLVEIVGIPWDRVHEEAHRLEHALSDYLAEQLAALLNDPQIDPHGQPIPSKDGEVLTRKLYLLSELREGEGGVIAEVDDDDPALLRTLADLNLFPGTRLVLSRRKPLGGGLEIDLDGVRIDLSLVLARAIRLTMKTESGVHR